MFDWWTMASIGLSVWVAGLSTWILFERRSPMATLAWILALALLPVIGILVYFAIGPRRFDRKKLRRRFAQEAVSKIGGLGDWATDAESSHSAYHLMAMCEKATGAAATPRPAKVELLTTGEEAYASIIEAIDAAEHHVHLEYYIWNADKIGTRVRDHLTAKAAAGVEVRIIIDSFGSSDANRRFWEPLLAAGGVVRRFNRLSISRLKSRLANFRTHRKILVVDGKVGFTGGMNIADCHTTEFSGAEAWRDTHVRIEGPAVRGLQVVFFEGWYYLSGLVPDGDAYFPEIEFDEREVDPVQVVCSGPDERSDAIHKLFFSAIAGANHRVYLSTAYFVPDATLLDAMSAAALRGADVRVLVPKKSDVKLVQAAGRSYYRELLDIGVRIFEYGPPMLHTKTLVVDDLLAVVGTANADARSFRLNFEVVVANYDPSVCELLAEIFIDDLEAATEVDDVSLAHAPFLRRLFENFARLLSPVL